MYWEMMVTSYHALHSIGAPLAEGEKDVPWPCAPIEQKTSAISLKREHLVHGSGDMAGTRFWQKVLCFRIASVQARDEGWLEHMLILKITSPEGSELCLRRIPGVAVKQTWHACSHNSRLEG